MSYSTTHVYLSCVCVCMRVCVSVCVRVSYVCSMYKIDGQTDRQTDRHLPPNRSAGRSKCITNTSRYYVQIMISDKDIQRQMTCQLSSETLLTSKALLKGPDLSAELNAQVFVIGLLCVYVSTVRILDRLSYRHSVYSLYIVEYQMCIINTNFIRLCRIYLCYKSFMRQCVLGL